MKLFALAATTAVTARSWSRVDTPAPGFVNEQGGYWADQPTHPQAPQVNYQVHQPYVQKPQCCEGYTWLSPTNEPLWMRKSGEHHDKPYYTATDSSGVTQVLFWKFIDGMGNAPVYAIPGRWYLSSSLGVTTGAETMSRETLGLQRCPENYQSRPYTANMDFRCDQQPPQRHQPRPGRQCCEWYEWTTTANNIVWMKFNGQHQNGKRIYQGVDSGTEKFMFYKPALPGSSAGAWYMGDKVNDPSARQSANVLGGLNSCPDQENLGWQGSVGVFSGPQCKSPPPAETCAEIHSKSILTQSSGGFTQCHIQKILDKLVIKQLDDLVKLFDHKSKPWLMRNAFPKAVQAWAAMTSKDGQEDNCGFKNDSTLSETGFVMTCDDFCDDIKKIKVPEHFKNVLEGFVDLVDSNFDKGTDSILF